MTPNCENSIILRHAIPKDIPFVYSTFLKSYKHDSKLGKSLRTSVFFENYKQILDRILSLPETLVNVACLNEDKDVILGYSITQNDVIHYVFIKDSFRKLGIATLLLKNFANKEIIYTHETQTAEPILLKKPNLKYNPFLLYRRDIHE